MQERHTQKIPVKKYLYFRKYKKDKFLTKRYIVLLLLYYYYFTATLLLFTIRILFFYISQNTTYLLTGPFCIHFSSKYLPIYFNAIIFECIKIWDFKIFKILKVKGALVPMCTKSLLVHIPLKSQFSQNYAYLYYTYCYIWIIHS
jgi:hypothetical protein